MALPIKQLKPAENEVTLDRIRKKASDEYQARIPEATKVGVQKTMKHLMEYGPIRNEFIRALVNRIGLVVAKNNSWDNPLREFKKGDLEYGDTVEEVQVGLIKATNYDTDRDSLEKDLFGTAKIDVDSSFHTINRQDKYKLTINETLLKRAFLEPMGLTSFAEQMMASFTTSDNWDEFLLTCALIPHYESNGGFHKIQIPNVSDWNSDAEDAKTALRRMRAAADNLTFLSTHYNAAHMPVAANRDDLIILTTPEYNAAIDVEALAGAFNISHAQMHGRIVPIPKEQLGIDGGQAVMTTKDFFQIWDTTFQTTDLFNPESLQYNNWLHHHQIISASRYAPAVLFTTKPGDEVIEIRQPVTSVSDIEVFDSNANEVTEVTRGELYQLVSEAITTPASPEGVNNGVRFTLSGNKSNVSRVTNAGVLYIHATDTAETVTVKAESTWIDPENPQVDPKSKTITIPVVGENLALWPIAGAPTSRVTGISVGGTPVTPAFSPTTFDYTVIRPGGVAELSEVEVRGPDTGDVEISLNGANDVITIFAPSAPGDPVYTVTVN